MTRNKSITVKTLHSILKLNIVCIQTNNQVVLQYVNDNPYEISSAINKIMKDVDRLCFFNYSVFLDEYSINKMFEKFPGGYNGVVFPAVKEGINWDMFKQKIISGSQETVSQMGLEFDTEVDKPINDDLWSVKSSNPKVWVVDTKSAIKALRTKKGEGVSFPLRHEDFFNKIKICAFVKAKVVLTYTHECISNILQSAGVSQKNETVPNEGK